MRLKIFTAENMQAALKQVRDALGDDAIIVNSHEEDGMVKVTAALEIPTARARPLKIKKSGKPKPSPVQRSLKDLQQEDQIESLSLSHFLSHHGLDSTMTKRIVDTAASFDEDGTINSLAKALDIMFHFNPLDNDYQNRPIMLVGPPGVGKTVTAAKLASQVILSGRMVRVINTDVVRTGGTAQLDGYAEVLKTTVIEVSEPGLLAAAIDTNRQEGELVIIDTMGYNPFDNHEMAELHDYITACDVEPILVIAAGTDPLEAGEISENYARLGVRRFITTRLDVARRYASLLTTAGAMDLAFAGVGDTPYLAGGIKRLDSMGLARLLTRLATRKIYDLPADNMDSDGEVSDLIIDDEEDENNDSS
ncbi:hypothetical protein MNBD_ALPHA01-1684 [hydrothermal vent metagenome]|uniref:Uncharacterized protein n=1 Tax=hydrothermal vent metagenome TaxID=652676 RepID=A0A3B0RJS9_9ZZZZ